MHIYVDARIATFERDDHWVARLPGLGVFAYGSDAVEAEQRLKDGFGHLVEGLSTASLIERLERSGNAYHVISSSDVGEPTVPTTIRARSGGGLEVAALAI